MKKTLLGFACGGSGCRCIRAAKITSTSAIPPTAEKLSQRLKRIELHVILTRRPLARVPAKDF